MGLRCKGCGGEEHVKNGFMRGKQRYRCKACGLNFTDTPPRGMPLAMKVTAVLLYVSRAVDEPHRQAAGRVHPQRDGLDRAVRRSVRAQAGARRAGCRGRAGRDVALSHKKTDKRSGSGRLEI